MTDYLQPHEGIVGNAGNLIDPLFVAPWMLLELTATVYSLSISQTPEKWAINQRMTSPQIGDRVVVLDAWYMRERNPDAVPRAVGYLLERRAEWWTTDAEWLAEMAEDGTLTDEDRMVEPAAWYIQYGPNPVDVCRWVNCRVLRIPVESPSLGVSGDSKETNDGD